MKKNFREKFKKIRENISFERREEASKKACFYLKEKAKKYKNILSFASKKKEIDIWEFNKFLEKEKKLFLPKIVKEKLCIYKVLDIKQDLVFNKQFNFLEPKASCEKVFLHSIDLVIVPSLVLDKNNHRIGYGKGYYDRLLFEKKIYSIAIGFKEQFSKTPLPLEKQDVRMDEVILF